MQLEVFPWLSTGFLRLPVEVFPGTQPEYYRQEVLVSIAAGLVRSGLSIPFNDVQGYLAQRISCFAEP